MWYSIGIEYGPGFNTKFSFLFFFLVVNRPKKKEKREFIVDDWSLSIKIESEEEFFHSYRLF